MSENLTHEYYLELKSQKLTRAQIAEIVGLTDNQLKRLIAKNGWGIRKTYTVNHNCFSVPTPESAYWAGFLAADGNVDEEYRVRLMLHASDLRHLEKFQAFTCSNHKISINTTKYNRASLEFKSEQMVKDLEYFWNITPRKSKTLQAPNVTDPALLNHFLRGYFDGDGTIGETFSNKNSITASVFVGFVSGSEDMTVWLQDMISERGATYSTSYFETKSQIKLNTNQGEILLNQLYTNSTEATRLDRKYDLYIKLYINRDRMTR